jgi:hypothetical protein
MSLFTYVKGSASKTPAPGENSAEGGVDFPVSDPGVGADYGITLNRARPSPCSRESTGLH